MFEMIKLPYSADALKPYMSDKTFEFHYGKHYKTYVDTLNKLVEGTKFSQMSLEEIIRQTHGQDEYKAIFNNAGQAWNHQFFWQSMSPNGGKPKGKLLEKIIAQYGDYEKFKQELKNAAVTQFGSGWAWVVDNEGVLQILKTANADTPVSLGLKPIICIDVWEHAYYFDYQNRRADYVEAFLEHLANWQE